MRREGEREGDRKYRGLISCSAKMAKSASAHTHIGDIPMRRPLWDD